MSSETPVQVNSEKVGDKPIKAAAEMVTFTINDKEISVPKGTTVMEAARQYKVYIPHFCWHPGLSVAGVCRFCMVKVEGRPKLEIACNLAATPGMKVYTQTPDVKDAHKWALEFHLVNHPLDCPICDQAGECKLQDYYMEVGQYKSQMERPKVLKPKALEVGDDLVLDTERCILCDRCVRFEQEVTKTGALGIFNRGDRAVIGTFPGKKITHNYQTNIVDICPVGAFTSKDFRFKQRVWFLKNKPAVCPGCSTGCRVDVYGKPETRTFYRVKPRESDVNKHWMCDQGRKTYKHLNQEFRLRSPLVKSSTGHKRIKLDEAYRILADQLKAFDAGEIALLVAPQYTCEEYEAFFGLFVKKLQIKNLFIWREPTEKIDDFDGILYRGDHNPNTFGLNKAIDNLGTALSKPKTFGELANSKAKVVIALAPEVLFQFPSIKEQMTSLQELEFVTLWTSSSELLALGKNITHALPMKGFAEKRGTFLNYLGQEGKLDDPYPSAVEEARDVAETVASLAEALSLEQ